MTLILKTIPVKTQLPDSGGGYKDYLGKIDGLIDYKPYVSMGESMKNDIENLLKNKNDPGAWMAFAASSVKESWMALPPDIRKRASDAIFEIIQDAVNNLNNVAADAFNAVSSKISDALPIIGTIIKVVIDLVMTAREIVQKIHQTNDGYTLIDLDEARTDTVARYQDPNDWILREMQVQNYLDYKGVRTGKGNWDLKPCFDRNSSESMLIFNEIRGQDDGGKCSGVPYHCDLDMNCEASPSSGDGDECIRYLGISALYYPYWSPSYGPIPVRRKEINSAGLVFEYSYPDYDMNSILIERQIALLTIPAINLQVDGEMVQRFADRFKMNWDSEYEQFGKTLLKIDDDGYALPTGSSDRLTIDRSFDKDNAQSSKNPRKFYYDENGLIQPYPGSGADLSQWGIRAKGGKYGDKYVGISAGQYNAVIGNTLAFFSARANFLRNGLIMKGMLQDYNVTTFWPDVRNAIQYSANYGKMLPTAQDILQQPGRAEKVPGRYSPEGFVIVAKRVGKGSSKSAMPILLIGGGILAIMALKGRK